MTALVRRRVWPLRSLAIAGVLVFALTACGATAAEGPEATPTPADTRFDDGATFGTAVFQ